MLRMNLSGTGGIEPDILVEEAHLNTYTETCQLALNQLDIYSLKNQDAELSKKQLLDGLFTFLSKDQSIDKSFLCDNLIQEEYEHRKIYLESGNEAWFKEINEEDPVILEALQKLKSEDLFAELSPSN